MPNFKHIATKDIPGEKEIFRTRPSGWIIFGRLLPLVVATFGLIVIFEPREYTDGGEKVIHKLTTGRDML